MTWQLRVAVRRGEASLVELAFERSPISIGALPQNDVVLSDPWVSAEHAVLHVSGGELVYRDRSRNGSFCDGIRIAEKRLGTRGRVSVPPFELDLELLSGDDTWHTQTRAVIESIVVPRREGVATPAPRADDDAPGPAAPRDAAEAGPAPRDAAPRDAPPPGPAPSAAHGVAPLPAPPPDDDDRLFTTRASAVGGAAPAGGPFQARLRVLRGEATLEGRTLAVPAREVKIGRSHRAELSVPVMTVSRLHATLAPHGDGDLVVTDLESTNGTFVNGHRIRAARLRLGDELRLGELVVRVEGVEAVDGAPEPPMTPLAAVPGSDLEVEVDPGSEGRAVVHLRGRLAAADGARVVAAADRALAGGARLVVFDLSELTEARDDALSSFVKARTHARARGAELRLQSIGTAVREALARSGLEPLFVPSTAARGGEAGGR